MLKWVTLVCAFVFASPSWAGTREDVISLYQTFAAAQNAHDAKAIARELLDSQQFLWVSDGKSIWGTEATIQRMSSFQASEVWRVEPHLDEARVVEVNDGAAYLHMPLDLVIGGASRPDRLAFLVSILCVKTPQGWKIAALFTTTAKP